MLNRRHRKDRKSRTLKINKHNKSLRNGKTAEEEIEIRHLRESGITTLSVD
jgi:hypothetical protein